MATPSAWLLVLALQDGASLPPAAAVEHVSVGGAGALILVMPCFVPSVRVSVPLGPYLAIDVDIGRALFWGNREIGQVPGGGTVEAQLRWMRHGRKPDGRGRYWLFGGSYANGRDILRGVVVKDYGFRNAQFGYGWDYLVRGVRGGFEIKVSPVGDGEGHARFFVVWGRR